MFLMWISFSTQGKPIGCWQILHFCNCCYRESHYRRLPSSYSAHLFRLYSSHSKKARFLIVLILNSTKKRNSPDLLKHHGEGERHLSCVFQACGNILWICLFYCSALSSNVGYVNKDNFYDEIRKPVTTHGLLLLRKPKT